MTLAPEPTVATLDGKDVHVLWSDLCHTGTQPIRFMLDHDGLKWSVDGTRWTPGYGQVTP